MFSVQVTVSLLLVALAGSALAAQFDDCGSVSGKVNAISVSGCAPADPVCKLQSGQNVSITVDFTSSELPNFVLEVLRML